MDSSSGRPQAGGQGVAGDSIVLEEEIDQNYVPSEVKPSSLFITVLDCSFREVFICSSRAFRIPRPLLTHLMFESGHPAGRGARVREMAGNGVGR